MKKKLLSLVLAGAMVASTSVSAFAADTEYDIAAGDKEHKVSIEGNVENERGQTVPGTISVTVPTSVAFTIGKDGNITGGEIRIVNKSNDKVEVVAKEFTDTTRTDKIVIVKDEDLDDELDNNASDQSKKYISLNLQSDSKSLGLISQKSTNKSGFVDDAGAEIDSSVGTSLGTAWRENDLTLRLTGRTKKADQQYAAPSNPIRDDFSLLLKIQKTTR